MSKSFDWPLRVYIEDTDAGGVVYHANHLKYMERARTEMLLAVGIDHAALIRDEKMMFVVRHAAIDYTAPARLMDDLVVNTSILKTGNASLTMRQIIKKREEVVATGDITLVCVTTSGQVCRIPAAILEKIG
jgi:tol-pal system-associated acyl-CoA thioesterase